VAHDNASSADTSRRTRIARARRAKTGRPVGGPRRFGWEPGNLELRQDEKAEIASWAELVLAGVSLRQIALDLRRRQVPSSRGGQWSSAQVRYILLSPAIMGRLAYRPAVPAVVPRLSKNRVLRPGRDHRRPAGAVGPGHLRIGLLGYPGGPDRRAAQAGIGQHPEMAAVLARGLRQLRGHDPERSRSGMAQGDSGCMLRGDR
jgi:Recombinase